MKRQPCVYILASRRHGTLYIGVTSNMGGRLHQHRAGTVRGFTKRYHVHRLVHFEMADSMETAIAREKQLKAWRRDWKIALIERDNPFWEDRAIALGLATEPAHPPGNPSTKIVHGS
ncbi:MAG: GIY-YIG nuclease family protein [Sphingomicrobium sp.]